MVGPLVAKLVSLRELGNESVRMDEMVIVLEVDLHSGMVLMQRADNRLYTYPFHELILEPDMRVTKLAPAGGRLV